MASIRQEKVSRLIQKDLSEIFQREVPELTEGKMVSVTTVRIAPDLGSARVYLSIFPGKDAEGILINVRENVHQLRTLLAKRVKNQMRKVPELHFYIDDSYDYAQRIDELLQ